MDERERREQPNAARAPRAVGVWRASGEAKRTEASATAHERKFPKSSPARTETSAAVHTRKFPKYANDNEGGACAEEDRTSPAACAEENQNSYMSQTGRT